MKKKCFLLVLICILINYRLSTGQISGTVQAVTITGTVTNKPVTFSIYLPPSYYTNSTKYYPVVYHTHGANQAHNGPHTVAIPQAFETANALGYWDEAIIVFPDGYTNSMWADSYDGLKPAETNVIQEIIPYVDATYRTIADKQHRLIQGFSMGGFGALKFYTKFPNLFCRVVLYDASLPDWAGLNAMYPSVASSIFNNSQTYFNQYSPWNYLTLNQSQFISDTLISIKIGVLSSYGSQLTSTLSSYGIPYSYTTTGCPHDISCLAGSQGTNAALFFKKCLIGNPLDVEELNTKKSADVFPNPTNGEIKLINLKGKSTLLEIYNYSGYLVKTIKIENNNSVDISELSPGLYFLLLKGQELKYIKLIKK